MSGLQRRRASNGTSTGRSGVLQRVGLLVAGATVLASGLSVAACSSSSTSASTKLSPTQERAALDAGLQSQRSGDVAAAVRTYQRVLTSDPGNKFAYYNLALMSQQQDRTSQAVYLYQKALVTDPNFVPALFNLAIAVTPSDLHRAIDLYRQVIALQPTAAAAHLNLGFALKSAGQPADGDAAIATARQLDPSIGGGGTIPATQPPQSASP